MADRLRVAAYCRVSTDQSDQANSLENQITYFTTYISGHDGWEPAEIYYDEGISGTSTKKRDGFNRMIEDAGRGRMDLILTKEVSRFARNTVDTLSHTRELKRMGVGVIFTIDGIDTRAEDGEVRLSIMASLAQDESRKTSERVKWGQTRRMEQGVVFGRDLLGYTVRGGKLAVVHEEAETVRLIFHKYLNEGKGSHTIARELREAGICPKRAAEWSNTVILRLLRNEKYVGDLCQKKTFTPDYLTHTKQYNRGREKQIYLKDHHEGIIDRCTWERTQAELRRRSSAAELKSKHSNRYWCSGKLVCGQCGGRFVSRTKKRRDGSIYKAWRCFAAANHGREKADASGNTVGCDSGSANERVLLTCVKYACDRVPIDRPRLLREILEEIRTVAERPLTLDTPKLRRRIEELNRKKREAVDLVLDGTISREDLKTQHLYYNEEIKRLSRHIAKEEADARTQRQSGSIKRYEAAIQNVLELREGIEPLFHELLEQAVVCRGAQVIVRLRYIPCEFCLQYRTFGKREGYRVQVTAEVIRPRDFA